MPRRRHGNQPDRLDLNLTALLDVVLQLIVFFIMLVHLETRIEESGRVVRLPVAPAALPTGALGQDRLVATLDASGRLESGDASLGPTEIGPWWADQAQLRREGRASLGLPPVGSLDELPTRVLIRADRDASYGAVRATLVAAQEAGFAQFSLLVLKEQR